MNYSEVIEYLYSQLPVYQKQGSSAYKANLDNTYYLDAKFNHPHNSFKTIHVGGTNGKGSVSHMLSSILQAAGYKVGLYTSPHLKDFRERIKVNGEMIGEEDVIEFVDDVKSCVSEIRPSFFEITVAMAFDYFKKRHVDIAVVEVGLGGRLDSTNIIDPLVSVITNVSIDHTSILGNTIEEIAKEKAGIIKKDTPVIVGEGNSKLRPIFNGAAENIGAPIMYAEDLYENTFTGVAINRNQLFNIKKRDGVVFREVECDLKGTYQKKNIKTVLSVVDKLSMMGFEISEKELREGVRNVVDNTGLKGRWQELSYNPLVICDTGHNEEGVRENVSQIKNLAWKKLHVIWGMVNDKDVEAVIRLLPKEGEYYFAKADNMRSMDELELQKIGEKYGLYGKCFSSVSQALENAKKNAEAKDLIFIGGSTFVVAEVI